MDENDVCRVRGDALGSIAFFKYVKLSQQKLDETSKQVFQKLADRMLKTA